MLQRSDCSQKWISSYLLPPQSVCVHGPTRKKEDVRNVHVGNAWICCHRIPYDRVTICQPYGCQMLQQYVIPGGKRNLDIDHSQTKKRIKLLCKIYKDFKEHHFRSMEQEGGWTLLTTKRNEVVNRWKAKWASETSHAPVPTIRILVSTLQTSLGRTQGVVTNLERTHGNTNQTNTVNVRLNLNRGGHRGNTSARVIEDNIKEELDNESDDPTDA
jgi:hypothetical protein